MRRRKRKRGLKYFVRGDWKLKKRLNFQNDEDKKKGIGFSKEEILKRRLEKGERRKYKNKGMWCQFRRQRRKPEKKKRKRSDSLSLSLSLSLPLSLCLPLSIYICISIWHITLSILCFFLLSGNLPHHLSFSISLFFFLSLFLSLSIYLSDTLHYQFSFFSSFL